MPESAPTIQPSVDSLGVGKNHKPSILGLQTARIYDDEAEAGVLSVQRVTQSNSTDV